MLIHRTNTYYPDQKGTIISMRGVHLIDLRIVAGGAGYRGSTQNTMLLGFRPNKNQYIMVFPGHGGKPGKDGQHSYIAVSPGDQFETVYSTPGSGEQCQGDNGYIEVDLRMELQEDLN